MVSQYPFQETNQAPPGMPPCSLGRIQAVPCSSGKNPAVPGAGASPPAPPAPADPTAQPCPLCAGGSGRKPTFPRASHDGGTSTSSAVLPRPAQLAEWTGCSNEHVSPQTEGPGGLALKLSWLQNRHEKPRFSLQVGWELAGSSSSPCMRGLPFPTAPTCTAGSPHLCELPASLLPKTWKLFLLTQRIA